MKMRVWALAMACVLGCASMTGCGSAREQNTHSLGADKPFGEVKRETEVVQTFSAEKETTESVVPEETVPTAEMTCATLVTEEEKEFLDSIMDVVEEITTGGSAEGLYVNLNGMGDFVQVYKNDVDAGIRAVLDEYDANKRSNHILLKDNLFSIATYRSSACAIYDGHYEINGGRVCFSYESYTNGNDPNAQVIRIDEPKDDRSWKAISERLLNMNEFGTYCEPCMPKVYGIDRFPVQGVYPIMIERNVTRKAEEEDVALEHHGEFLCVETYGFELDTYTKGEAFSITYNPERTILLDEYSRYNMEGWDEAAIDKQLGRYCSFFGQDESAIGEDTTLEFSDGHWEWYNSDGGLINNGIYQESQDYPGFIMMSVEENSVAVDTDQEKATFTHCMPLLFYIAEDGEIYYPAFVRAE
ncbi:MAG: hypothetical protein E7511_06490 [Ruminococcus sp.]|nr:hypothetical protein [Ruminococcus sp.]